jgi:DHA1 family bicyclomycin/chloramphenicol resistance-like MFS transporter
MTRTPPRLVTLILLTALTVITTNMFLPALPQMRADFGVSEAVMGLSISAYMAAAAVLQLALGPLSDRIGRRPVLLGCMAVYAAAALVALLAQDIVVFLLARTLQAVAVAGGVLASAVVRDMFDGRRAAANLATIASAMAVAPMLAPLLGGFLTGAFGWRAVFWAYFALGAGLLAWCWRDIGETHARQADARPEPIGALLGARRFWAYAFCHGLGVGAFYIFLTGAPFVAADVFGYSAQQIGIGLGSITAGFMLGAAVSARSVARLGPMPLILAGRLLPLAGLSAGLLAYLLGDPPGLLLFAATLCVGVGNGLTLANANAGALSVRPKLAGTAAGVAGALALLLGAALTSLATAVLAAEASPERLLGLMIGAVVLSLGAALAARRWDRGAGVAA